MCIESNKWVLITGGAKRLGRSIAEKLHGKGYNIIIHYHQSEQEAYALQSFLNKQRADTCCIFSADLTSQTAVNDLIQKVISDNKELVCLINNASSYLSNSIDNFSQEQWDANFNTHAKAPYQLAAGLAPLLRANHGCIINMLDVYASQPLKGHSIYTMSKATLKMLTESLALELAPQVRVNAIAPGAILWPEDDSEMSQEEKTEWLNKIPMQRLGRKEEIAKAALFILESSYINGETIHIDGGLRLV